MKSLYLFLSLFFLSIFSSCEKKELSLSDETLLNLSNLKVGQKSLFRRYEAVCGNQNEFKYLGDTLIMEVVDSLDELYLKEKYTEGSVNQSGYTSMIHVDKVNQGLRLTDRGSSSFFNFYGNDTLRLNNPSPIPMKQENCIVTFNDITFRGDEVGKIQSFKIGDISIFNKVIVSCIPMIEVDGYLIYDDQQLILNYAHFNSTFNGITSSTINGWVKIQ